MNRFLITVKYSAIHKRSDADNNESPWLIDELKAATGGFFSEVGRVVDDRFLADVGGLPIATALAALPDDSEPTVIAAWSDEGTTPLDTTTYPFKTAEYLKHAPTDEDGNKSTEAKPLINFWGWPTWEAY